MITNATYCYTWFRVNYREMLRDATFKLSSAVTCVLIGVDGQAGVTEAWVRARITEATSPLQSQISTIQTDINSSIRPWIGRVEDRIASLEHYIDHSLYPWIQAIHGDLAALEKRVNDMVDVDLDPIIKRLDVLEAVWNSEMIEKIDGVDTRITELQEWVGTSIATLADYVEVELFAISDDITHIMVVELPTIGLNIAVIEDSISNALLLMSERFSLTAIERHAWDWYPEVTAAQWLGKYKTVFPEYKNILKLWLARILQ